jgi:hypothetical protein
MNLPYYLPLAVVLVGLDRLGQEPRFHLHFTPTNASWLKLVEQFFRDLVLSRPSSTERVQDLVEAIRHLLSWSTTLEANRYQWRADGAEVLRKIKAPGWPRSAYR